MSKKAKAIKIVQRMEARKKPATREQILTELVNKADLSANGAATYYQNVKLGRWS